jgi:ribonuclease P protein component
MPDLRLPRSERLRSLKSIRRVFGEGRGGFVYPFRYTFYISQPGDNLPAESCAEQCAEAAGAVQVMFSVPKKFHKRANKRNLLKRRTREAFRQSAEREVLRQRARERSCAVNLAFIYSTKEVHSYKTINNAVQRILGQISEGL